MTQLILDTDHVSLLQRNEPLVVKRFNEAVREEIAITIITVKEQMRGRLSSIKQAGSSARIISAYAKLQARQRAKARSLPNARNES